MMQKLRQFKEKFGERFEEVQEKFRSQWIAFNPREKMIISILGGMMLLLIMVLVAKETSTLLTKANSEAENNYKNIEKIQALLRDLGQQRSDLMKYERLRGKRGESFKLQAFVEAEAARYGTVIAKTTSQRVLSPTGKEVAEKDLKEEWLEVQLKDASLDSTLKFLMSIEDTLGLRIVELKIKPQFADPTKLDVTTTIADQQPL